MGVASRKIKKAVSKKALTKRKLTRTAKDICANCCVNKGGRERTFSDQTWTKLLLWGEINPEAIHKTICDTCYFELRDILIERMDDNELVAYSKKRCKDAEKTVQDAKI